MAGLGLGAVVTSMLCAAPVDTGGDIGAIMKKPLIIIGVMAVILSGWTSPAHAATPGDYRVIAHRGWIEGSRITENSYRALVRAARHGATSAETDVRMTKDRSFVLMHDKGFARTTTSTGRVDLRTKRDIKRHVRLNDGEHVPSLSGWIHTARRYAVNVVIELKADRRDRWRVRDMSRMVDMIAARHMTPRVTFLSFNADLLRMVEVASPGLPTVWIARRSARVTPERIIARGVDGVSVRPDVMTPKSAQLLRDYGLRIQGRESNTVEAWQQFADVGITDVVTDATPERAAWLQ
jgi:glycerophosphoryl diester phosphodiesterase